MRSHKVILPFKKFSDKIMNRQDEFIFYTLLCLLLMLLLLLFPGVAHRGTDVGLELFFESLFPYLLPYLILTNWILQLTKSSVSANWMSYGKTYLLSALGGFPTGAVIISQLLKSGELTKKEAAFLLPICHNPSPLFVIGLVATTIIQDISFGWKYLAIAHLISITLLFTIYPFFRNQTRQHQPIKATLSPFSSSITESIRPIAIVGTTVIFFSAIYTVSMHVLKEFYSEVPELLYLFVAGFLEFTNGIVLSSQYLSDDYLKLFVVFLLTSQSFSIHLQVYIITRASNISFLPYICIRGLYCILVPLLFFAFS